MPVVSVHVSEPATICAVSPLEAVSWVTVIRGVVTTGGGVGVLPSLGVQTGVPVGYIGNEGRYTVQSDLKGATWYRRVRAGT